MAGPPPERPGDGVTPSVGVASVSFAAAVLCGGASRRLGTDKAAVLVDGVPLAVAVGRVARAAGAVSVVGVGPRSPVAAALAADGMAVLDDRWPGEGPAAGVATALLRASTELLVVLGCDHPWLQPRTVARLVAVLADEPDRAVVVAGSGGRLHPTVGAWRVGACTGPAVAYLAGGGRSLLGLVEVVGGSESTVDGLEVRDVDTPADLAALDPPGPPATADTIGGSATRRDDGSTSR